MAQSDNENNTKLSYSMRAGSEFHEITALDKICDPCDRDGNNLQAKGFCLMCHEFLCSKCYDGHCLPTPMKHHQLLALKDMPDFTVECTVHPVELLQYYCFAHDQNVCPTCREIDHKDCLGVEEISGVATDLKVGMQYTEFNDGLKEMSNRFEDLGQVNDSNAEGILHFYENALDHIKDFRKDINQTLDKLESNVLEEVQSMRKRDSDKNTISSHMCKKAESKITQLNSELKQFRDANQNCRLFIEMTSAKHQIENLKESIEYLENENAITKYKFEGNQLLKEFLEKLTTFGCLLTRGKCSLVDQISTQLETDKKVCNVTGMCLLSNDRLVIADASNKSVKLMNLKKQSILCQMKAKFDPWDVTKVARNSVAVSYPSENSIKILDFNATSRFSVNREMQVDGLCRGIEHNADKLYVSFTGPIKIDIFTMDGQILKRFSKEIIGKSLFHWPLYLSVATNDDKICVSDVTTNRIVCLNKNGVLLRAFAHDKMSKLAGLTLDNDGNIYICDQSASTIFQILPNCNRISDLLSRSDIVPKPRAICYCKASDKLYVSSLDSNKISVLQLEL